MASPPLFQRATVTRVIRENRDVNTLVFAPHDGPFRYRAGQFCTFRVHVNGRDLQRSYSMSSAPETDTELMTTVKRVPGGAVSNWLIDNIEPGDEVEVTRPRGMFCLRPATGPVLGFSGGSGITPILSLAKSALASSDRTVRLLCADRDGAAVIFDAVLADLAERYPGRLVVVRHLDAERGLLDAAAVREFLGPDTGADSYICGPEPFMALVESALTGPGAVYTERFGGDPPPVHGTVPDPTAHPEPEGTVTIVLGNKRVSVSRRANETLLESARRAGLTPPFSCEAGNCATCIARLTSGTARMRVNDALTEEEVADGYVLTCQSVPESPSVTVRYE
jgi:ferredoxin-NADP reductase